MNIPCLLPRAARQNSRTTTFDDDDGDAESSLSGEVEDSGDGETSRPNTDSTDYQKVLRLLEEGEKVRILLVVYNDTLHTS